METNFSKAFSSFSVFDYGSFTCSLKVLLSSISSRYQTLTKVSVTPLFSVLHCSMSLE